MTTEVTPPKVDRKARLKIPPQHLPKQDPAARIRNWNEVALPLDLETAKVEATRCIQAASLSSSSTHTAAGLPLNGSDVKASTCMILVMFSTPSARFDASPSIQMTVAV